MRAAVRAALTTSILLLAGGGTRAADVPTHHAEFLSEPYTIDRIYKSMAGPEGKQIVRLWTADPPELLWITGYRVRVVGADGTSAVSQEFMCHNNLDYNPLDHARVFGSPPGFSTRLFTLSQGQFAVDLPAGFGLPIMSNETLYLSTQVLNHNLKDAHIRRRLRGRAARGQGGGVRDDRGDRDAAARLVSPRHPGAGFQVFQRRHHRRGGPEG